MTNVIIFPEKLKEGVAENTPKQKSIRKNRISAFFLSMLTCLRTVLFLLWPLIRWFVYGDLLLAFLKMSLQTNNHATYDFIFHCFIILLGVLFVFLYQPQSLKKNKGIS